MFFKRKNKKTPSVNRKAVNKSKISHKKRLSKGEKFLFGLTIAVVTIACCISIDEGKTDNEIGEE